MRRLGSLLLALAVCAGLAACGSSGSNSTKSTSSTSTTVAGGGSGSTNAARLVGARVAAAKCMRGQGIDIPDPGPTRASVVHMLSVLASFPQAKVQSAEQACMALIRKAFPNATSLTPAERAQRLQETEAFATCMRSHGINFPDPASYAGNPSGLVRAISLLDQSSPAFKAAGNACKSLALKDAGG